MAPCHATAMWILESSLVNARMVLNNTDLFFELYRGEDPHLPISLKLVSSVTSDPRHTEVRDYRRFEGEWRGVKSVQSNRAKH